MLYVVRGPSFRLRLGRYATMDAVDADCFAELRFWRYVAKGDGCWTWTGLRRGRGYGVFHVGQSAFVAHRWIYERIHGSVDADLKMDHLCRNRLCVNPEHLEPVTDRVNILRGESQSAENARKTHCINGHALDGDNLRIAYRRGRACRQCRACESEQRKRKWAAMSVEQKAAWNARCRRNEQRRRASQIAATVAALTQTGGANGA